MSRRGSKSSVPKRWDLVFRPNLDNIDAQKGDDRALLLHKGEDFRWLIMHISKVEMLPVDEASPKTRVYQTSGELITGGMVECVFEFDDQQLRQAVTVTDVPAAKA